MRRLTYALIWLAVTTTAVFIAAAAVGSVRDQVTETPTAMVPTTTSASSLADPLTTTTRTGLTPSTTEPPTTTTSTTTTTIAVSTTTTLQATDLELTRPSGDELDKVGPLSLEEVERRHIANMLKHTNGNVSQTARLLGIDRVTLYNKIRKYDIKRPNHEAPHAVRDG